MLEDLGEVTIREAVHGKSMVLTIDSDLQAICENRLRERVAASGAKPERRKAMRPSGR